jgi:hypothetical protein
MKTPIKASTAILLMALPTLLGQTDFTEILEGPQVNDLGVSVEGSWGDYDGDGDEDLMVHRFAQGTWAIYRNNGDGTYSSVAPPPSLAGMKALTMWGDWNNDGWLDLMTWDDSYDYIAFGDGKGDFAPESLGFVGMWSACTTADYDRDGWLDLYYLDLNALYRNLGNRSFASMPAAQIGPVTSQTYGFGACWADFNDDGWPDLFVPSQRESRCYLFQNLGNGRFAAVDNLVSRIAAPSLTGAWGDYNNDNRLDLCVVNFNGTTTVYRNLGDGQFDHPEGVPSIQGTHNFAAWVDYDNDGFLDLWVSGYMSGNKLFRNNGDGSFAQITTGSLIEQRPPNGAGTYFVAWFDCDNDGFLDAYLFNGDDYGSILTANQHFRNQGNENAWLTVKLSGTVSNRDAVGAKVRTLAAYAGQARWQRRDISGGNLPNGNHRYAHFGLGDAAKVDTLRIEWPSGIVQELRDVPANQILAVTEPPRLVPQGVGAFQIQCWINQVFDVQASPDLAHWSTAATVTNTTGTLIFQDTEGEPQTAACFYRVVSR